MAGLQWVRLDTAFPTNHKVLQLVEDAKWRSIVSYVSGLAHSGAHGTDGFVPAGALPFIHGTRMTASHLVAVGLWVPRPGGWEYRDWREFQPSSEETAARSDRARAAAQIRWARERGQDPLPLEATP